MVKVDNKSVIIISNFVKNNYFHERQSKENNNNVLDSNMLNQVQFKLWLRT